MLSNRWYWLLVAAVGFIGNVLTGKESGLVVGFIALATIGVLEALRDA